jgi:Ni/Co efflux regulator RcnB
MPTLSTALLRTLILGLTLGTALHAAQAAKPDWAEGGQNGKGHGKQGKGDKPPKIRQAPVARVAVPTVSIQIGGYFSEPQRQATRAYYEPRVRSGQCPPGLAKKRNGCMPPGQARKWRRGQVLPPSIVYYPVPAAVQVQLGPPPSGHKFVRVATDILLIAVGTGMVIDAIEDLGGL